MMGPHRLFLAVAQRMQAVAVAAVIQMRLLAPAVRAAAVMAALRQMLLVLPVPQTQAAVVVVAETILFPQMARRAAPVS